MERPEWTRNWRSGRTTVAPGPKTSVWRVLCASETLAWGFILPELSLMGSQHVEKNHKLKY